MSTTALQTYTVSILSLGDQVDDTLEAEDIFSAPAAYVRKVVAKFAEDAEQVDILNNLRHGELGITGDRRRWFLHQVQYQRCDSKSYCYEPEDVFVIITADEAV